jgi:hypothetical protein
MPDDDIDFGAPAESSDERSTVVDPIKLSIVELPLVQDIRNTVQRTFSNAEWEKTDEAAKWGIEIIDQELVMLRSQEGDHNSEEYSMLHHRKVLEFVRMRHAFFLALVGWNNNERSIEELEASLKAVEGYEELLKISEKDMQMFAPWLDAISHYTMTCLLAQLRHSLSSHKKPTPPTQ